MTKYLGDDDSVFGFATLPGGQVIEKRYDHAKLPPIYSHSRWIGDNDTQPVGTTLVTVVIDANERCHVIAVCVVAENEGWNVLAGCEWGDLPTRTTLAIMARMEQVVCDKRQAADEAAMAASSPQSNEEMDRMMAVTK